MTFGARRLGYALAAAFLLAFAFFEMAKHGRVVLVAGLIALIAPDLTLLIGRTPPERGRLAPAAVPWYNAAHSTIGPWIVLCYFAFRPARAVADPGGAWAYLLPTEVPEAAAGFTVGLAWLAHICLDRALGYGRRDPAGWIVRPT